MPPEFDQLQPAATPLDGSPEVRPPAVVGEPDFVDIPIPSDDDFPGDPYAFDDEPDHTPEEPAPEPAKPPRKPRFGGQPESAPAPEVSTGQAFQPRPVTREFSAELDMAELDDRERPGTTWIARAQQLSRSNVVILSRRMCYIGRTVVMAVHLIDAEPVPLFGKVHSCEYDAEGMYRLDVDLEPLPESRRLDEWLKARARG